MKFVQSLALGGAVKIFPLIASVRVAGRPWEVDYSRNCVATFSDDEEGQLAFALFKAGLTTQIGAELFDMDTGKFIIADMAKMGLEVIRS